MKVTQKSGALSGTLANQGLILVSEGDNSDYLGFSKSIVQVGGWSEMNRCCSAGTVGEGQGREEIGLRGSGPVSISPGYG
jgi:hypothetical protein